MEDTTLPDLPLPSSTFQRPRTSPDPSSLPPQFNAEPIQSRQQSLLRGRNARFLAKKLSISSLNSRLTGVVQAEERSGTHPQRDQENIVHKSRSAGTLSKRFASSQSLSILGEISNSTRYRSLRKHNEIPVYEDNIERPLLDDSPLSSPQPCVVSSETTSPIPFNQIHDSLTEMRTRNISSGGRFSPSSHTPLNTLKQSKARKAAQSKSKFDVEEYIEHIEHELQQAKEDAYSPRTKRPLREKLQNVLSENAQLQEELLSLRDKYEIEFRKVLDHRTSAEVDLRRKVKDLEEKLETKEQTIQDLMYQHEEKRLDSSIIETLKITIDRLEQDKQDMEIENANVTKRNEVLTQLLAMSPTKTYPSGPTSPVRDKRNVRPMSLIIPRMPTSPETQSSSRFVSNVNSPESEAPGYFEMDASNVLLESAAQRMDSLSTAGLGINNGNILDQSAYSTTGDADSRRTLSHSDIVPASASSHVSPTEENRATSRRKPRRFLRGSTQLRPLLLPALTDNNAPSISSTISSPAASRARSSSELSLETSASVVRYTEKVSDLLTESTTDVLYEESGPGPTCDDYLDSDMEVTVIPECMPNVSSELLHSRQISHTNCAGHPLNFTMQDRDPLPFDSEEYQECKISHIHDHKYDKHVSNVPVQATGANWLEHGGFSAIPQPLFSPRLSRPKSVADMVIKSQDFPSTDQFSDTLALRWSGRSLDTMNDVVDSPTAKYSRRRPISSSLSLLPVMPPSADWSKVHHSAKMGSRIGDTSPTRSRSSTFSASLYLFKHKEFRARAIASLGIRTVYGLLATCSSVIRDAKRDPYALVRKALARAWHANWAIMGKVSWWVLGLFVGSRQTATSHNSINWDAYDGESIAHRVCSTPTNQASIQNSSPAQSIQRRCDAPTQRSSIAVEESHCIEPQDPVGGAWSKSLLLWGKFSVAIMMTIGSAVVHGPGEILQKMEGKLDSDSATHPLVDVSEGSINVSQRHLPQSSPEIIGWPRNRYDSSGNPREQNLGYHRSSQTFVSPELLRQFRSESLPFYAFQKTLDEDSTLRATAETKPHAKDIFSDNFGAQDFENNSSLHESMVAGLIPERSAIDKVVRSPLAPR